MATVGQLCADRSPPNSIPNQFSKLLALRPSSGRYHDSAQRDKVVRPPSFKLVQSDSFQITVTVRVDWVAGRTDKSAQAIGDITKTLCPATNLKGCAP